MKKKLLSILLIVVTNTAFSQIQFDLKKSDLKWTGSKITGQSHSGSLEVSSASLSIDDTIETLWSLYCGYDVIN